MVAEDGGGGRGRGTAKEGLRWGRGRVKSGRQRGRWLAAEVAAEGGGGNGFMVDLMGWRKIGFLWG